MMLTEQTPVPEAALPLAPFKAHLQLGTGFGEDSLQDEVLISFLRASVAAIEARTGKVLMSRQFELNMHQWRDPSAQALPLVPVTAIATVVLIDAAGGEEILAADRYQLIQDSQHPQLCPSGSLLPTVATGGALRITLTAGMAADWGDLPADLAQAVLMLAAHYYHYRDDTGLSGGCMPFGVTSLIERYRVVRLGLGRLQ
ncbi:MAG: phage head-tail connector protein [Rhodobacteraceae bacterium]|nr:phage head-tail connector protein [Paracoccaceae bacterium]